jgi:protein gp37
MSDGTAIQWTEATWNPLTGCSVVSPGCTNCYAMKLAGTRLQHHSSRAGLTRETKAGPVWTGEVRFNDQWLDQPLRWRRPRMIFVCAHSDLFHPAARREWVDRIFAVMALARHHTFQVLTKRPERMREYLTGGWQWRVEPIAAGMRGKRPLLMMMQRSLPNVWIGTSVEDQQRADERIPVLIDTPAPVRWLSCEPLLGPVDVFEWLEPTRGIDINWVVVGCESGPGARPMDIDWARSLRDQCGAAGVAFFCKQLSIPGSTRVLHDLADFPPDLRVRQYPDARSA